MSAATIILLSQMHRRNRYYGGGGGGSDDDPVVIGMLLGLVVCLFIIMIMVISGDINDPVNTCVLPTQTIDLYSDSTDENRTVALLFTDHGTSGEIYPASCHDGDWKLGTPAFSSLELTDQNYAMSRIPCSNPIISQKLGNGKYNTVHGVGWVCQKY